MTEARATMRSLPVFLFCAACICAQSRATGVVIDGELNDPIWTHVPPGQLRALESGVPEDGGEIRARISGRFLYLAARLPESSGRVVARSIGKNPSWEAEDSISIVIRVLNENDWMLKIGPLAGYSVEWRWTGEPDWYLSRPDKCAGFLVAAAAGDKEWRAEAAIPLSELGSPGAHGIEISAIRVRAARPASPRRDRKSTRLNSSH